MVMQAYSKLDKQDTITYDKPTECTMKDRGNSVYCKCGHTVEFWTNENKVLCTYCNKYVFKTKKDEFDYRMKGILKK
jgi:NADH pyrophosphatase NudC (nudix superfamily)